MRTPKSVRHIARSDHLQRQALGFAVMLLALGGAFVGARTQSVALEPSPTMDAPPTPELEPHLIQAQLIRAHIEDASVRYGVDPRLVAAVIAIESEFHPHAVSRRGAEGLMQLMPETAAIYDVQDSFDVRDNIEGGVRHLRRLMDRFGNDIPLALAAYNAGEHAVLAYRGIPPYRETRQYVVRVLYRYDRDAARAVARQLAAVRRVRPAVGRTPPVMALTSAVSVSRPMPTALKSVAAPIATQRSPAHPRHRETP